MAARGARSRKVLDKTIEKTERKKDAKAITNSFNRADSPSQWDISSNSRSEGSARSSNGMSPHLNRVKNASNTRNNSRPSSASGMSSVSDQSRDKVTYQSKGKDSAHPRGRGGGVPAKGNTSTDRPSTRTETARPPTEMRTSDNKRWLNMTIWSGDGQRPQPWRGFESDSDLWMETGDCYVYFTEETDSEQPRPAMRLHVSELQKAKSTLLNNLIRYGTVEKDEDEIEIFPRVISGRGVPSYSSSSRSNTDGLRSPRWDSFDGAVRPLNRISNTSTSTRSPVSPRRPNRLDGPLDSYSGFPVSYDEIEVTHEIWFPAPAYLKTPQAQLRHHIAQRNFFAVLYNKPIVGSDFLEMLHELQTVIDTFYELDNKGQTQWSAQMLARYLLLRRLDDVRGNMRMALGLLAWCEQDNVRWMGGYLEAYVHCAGLMHPNAVEYHEFRRLSTVTRMNLNNAANMLQLRILEAEEKLASFDLSDLWSTPPSRTASSNPYQMGFVSFQDFLIKYYTKIYKAWPPPANSKGRWLTRDLVRRLQQDLGALYDYLVDRSVSWSEQESRASRKWQMVAKRPLPEALPVDSLLLPLTDMFIGFDNRHGYLHIPHPYPLLPANSKPIQPAAPVKKSLFGGLKKSKAPSPQNMKEQLQTALAFNDATNLDKLGVAFQASDLIDQFDRYEKATDLKTISPPEARLGRWVLLYGILQILSNLSVDIQGLKHSDGVDYFLCPMLKKCPPWDPNGRLPMAEATQLGSYCWLAPRRWEAEYQRNKDRAGKSPQSLMELGGSGFEGISELDGRSIPVRRLDREFGSMFIEDKGMKYRLERPNVPERNPLRGAGMGEKRERSYLDDDQTIEFLDN